jgi:hypothetical protein
MLKYEPEQGFASVAERLLAVVAIMVEQVLQVSMRQIPRAPHEGTKYYEK